MIHFIHNKRMRWAGHVARLGVLGLGGETGGKETTGET